MLAFPQAGRFFKVRLQFAVGQRVLVVKGLPKNGQAITLVRSMATAVVVGQIMCMPHQVNGQGGDQDCCGIIRLILQLEEAAIVHHGLESQVAVVLWPDDLAKKFGLATARRGNVESKQDQRG